VQNAVVSNGGGGGGSYTIYDNNDPYQYDNWGYGGALANLALSMTALFGAFIALLM